MPPVKSGQLRAFMVVILCDVSSSVALMSVNVDQVSPGLKVTFVSCLSSALSPQLPVCLSAIRTLESRTKTCLHDHPRAPTFPLHRSVTGPVASS